MSIAQVTCLRTMEHQQLKVILFVFLLNKAVGWNIHKFHKHEENVCRVRKEKIETVMRKNITSTTSHSKRRCGTPSNPDRMCPVTRINSVINWFPEERMKVYVDFTCCPGWTGYIPGEGCHIKAGCQISLPQYDKPECLQTRKIGIMKSSYFFKLSKPIKPNDPKRKPTDVLFPLIDQPIKAVAAQAMMDPLTAHWFNVYFHGLLARTNETGQEAQKRFEKRNFDSYEDYIDVYNFFIKKQEQNPLPYFKNPSSSPNFVKITDGKWRDDKYFVEQRLAGLNPMYLKRVTLTGDVGMRWESLYEMLNKTFPWQKAIQKIVGENYNLSCAIENGLIYAIDYDNYHDIPHAVDILDTDPTDNRVMRESTSPIILFAIGKSQKMTPELKVAAIQMDYKPESPVYTPDDGHKWNIAKGMAQTADFASVEIYDHLLRTHLRMEPICVCFPRHLSKKHPLHQILKYHCRGMIPVNNYGFPKLTNELAYMHKLFGMGHVGTFRLLNEGFLKMHWRDNDLVEDMQRRGLDDKELLPFFPYRDDGQKIYDILKRFGRDVAETYYSSDDDVVGDTELQSLMNELSADGIVTPDGGNGMIRGLPSAFLSKQEVADFLFRCIWLVIQHTAVNYPIIDYGAFSPNMPTKLYEDPNNPGPDPYLLDLPGKTTAILQSFISINLGTIRYDKMFDYAKALEDDAGKELVSRYYQEMMTELKPEMEAIDRQRVADGHLSYPYLTPGWLPNSIHT